jgi:hypothetical protein
MAGFFTMLVAPVADCLFKRTLRGQFPGKNIALVTGVVEAVTAILCSTIIAEPKWLEQEGQDETLE